MARRLSLMSASKMKLRFLWPVQKTAMLHFRVACSRKFRNYLQESSRQTLSQGFHLLRHLRLCEVCRGAVGYWVVVGSFGLAGRVGPDKALSKRLSRRCDFAASTGAQAPWAQPQPGEVHAEVLPFLVQGLREKSLR